MKMTKGNIWNVIGLVIGIVMIIIGIVFAAAPPDTYNTDSAEYASFGADFYTYQYKATKIVAQNTAVTANNLREMGESMALYFGMGFVFAGALVVVNYGRKMSEAKAERQLAGAESACCAPQAVETEPEAVPAADEQ